MFYKSELMHHRYPKFYKSGDKGLQIFDKAINKQQKFKYHRYTELIERYAGSNCCIHGIHYLWSEYKHGWQRYFWIAVILLAIFGSSFMFSKFMEHHSRKELKTIVETTRMGIHKIDFPAVAICPVNHVNTMRIAVAEERFLPRNVNAKTRTLFRNLAMGMNALEFGAFEIFGRLEPLRADLEWFDKFMSISKLASSLTFRCDDLFERGCKFNNLNYDCCKVFVPERTEKGICLVFNSVISEQSKKIMIAEDVYPRRVEKPGEGNGLRFTLRYNKTFYQALRNERPFSMNVMIKEPDEWSDTLTHTVYANTHNVFAVDPRMTVTNTNTRILSPEQRRCLFDGEKSDKFQTTKGLNYNKMNCRTHCMQEHLLKICNCTVPLFFPPPKTNLPECRASDFICIYKNRDIFGYTKTSAEDEFITDERRGMNCDCVSSCESIDYLINFDAIKLENTSTDIISFDIYLASEFLTKYATSMEHTLLDLFASFGGTLGLFMGASLVSFIELVYYLLLLLFRVVRDRKIIWKNLHSKSLKNIRKIKKVNPAVVKTSNTKSHTIIKS